jgi:hypothetical protein
MGAQMRSPVAGAAASRADASMLASTGDLDVSTERACDRQVSYILKLYALSLPVALVVAEHAFQSGRRT